MSLFIGDTVLVNEGAAATILTPSKKKIKNIAIFLKDDDESADEEKENSLPDPQNFGRGRRTALVESKLRMDSTAEEKRKAHQKELMAKMNEEALRRIKAGGDQVKQLSRHRQVRNDLHFVKLGLCLRGSGFPSNYCLLNFLELLTAILISFS